jgi:DNA repair exonuclease SbcCD nuclease subunit
VPPFNLIGDPHIGRAFPGTPLHRKGEREAMQLEQLAEELMWAGPMNVMVGDMFDHPNVDMKFVHQVADLYEEIAPLHSDTLFILLAGNHDLFRQVRDPKTGEQMKGAFHALARMLKHLPNVIVLFKPQVINDVAFFPWDWSVSALEQVKEFDVLPLYAVGHWDLHDFGGSVAHLCPYKALAERGVQSVWSGHFHTAGDYDIDGGVVHCTGSMQPYTHAEDPDGKFYRTLTLDQIESMDLHDVNIRLVLQPGEAIPDLDCLSLVTVREGETESLDLERVGLGNFDVIATLERNMEDLQVILPVRNFVREKIGAIN